MALLYGLHVRAWHSSKIILHAPLTKKSVSQNNHGRDWGVDGRKCVNPGTIEEKSVGKKKAMTLKLYIIYIYNI